MRTDMREKISIIHYTDSQDEYGENSQVWVNFKTGIWASKEQLLGNEFYTAEATNSNVEVKFRTFWFDGVDNTMRIVHNGETYEILSAINPKTQNRELLIYAKKVVVV